jgi:hypothetical protein
MNKLFNIQLFADGGDGAGAGAGAEGNANNVGAEQQAVKTPAKSKVVYGKQPHEETTLPTINKDVTDEESEDRSTAFETMIKGEFKDEFDNRVQQIMSKRFKNMDSLKAQVSAAQPILDMLASKYGVDPADTKALAKAIEDDESLYEQEAMDRGITVEQLKHVKKLERENAMMAKEIQEQENRANGEKLYAAWLDQAEQFKEDYGLDFDLGVECQNPDFLNLLSNGISVEDAYMAIHHKEVIGNAMATTAAVMKQKVASNVAARSSRPSENGLKAQPATVVKSDVHSLTKEDRAEIARRVAAGEEIRF